MTRQTLAIIFDAFGSMAEDGCADAFGSRMGSREGAFASFFEALEDAAVGLVVLDGQGVRREVAPAPGRVR